MKYVLELKYEFKFLIFFLLKHILLFQIHFQHQLNNSNTLPKNSLYCDFPHNYWFFPMSFPKIMVFRTGLHRPAYAGHRSLLHVKSKGTVGLSPGWARLTCYPNPEWYIYVS